MVRLENVFRDPPKLQGTEGKSWLMPRIKETIDNIKNGNNYGCAFPRLLCFAGKKREFVSRLFGERAGKSRSLYHNYSGLSPWTKFNHRRCDTYLFNDIERRQGMYSTASAGRRWVCISFKLDNSRVAKVGPPSVFRQILLNPCIITYGAVINNPWQLCKGLTTVLFDCVKKWKAELCFLG